MFVCVPTNLIDLKVDNKYILSMILNIRYSQAEMHREFLYCLFHHSRVTVKEENYSISPVRI